MAVRTFVTLGVVLLVSAWAAVWKVSSDRADRELLEAKNASLREEIASNERFIAGKAELERLKADHAACEPAFARILPMRDMASDEKLLFSIQNMAEASGVRIVEVTVQERSR